MNLDAQRIHKMLRRYGIIPLSEGDTTIIGMHTSVFSSQARWSANIEITQGDEPSLTISFVCHTGSERRHAATTPLRLALFDDESEMVDMLVKRVRLAIAVPSLVQEMVVEELRTVWSFD